MNTSNTISFTTTVNMVKFFKDKKRNALKERIKLNLKLSKTKWYQLIYRYILNKKIKAIDDKIQNLNEKIEYYKLKEL